MLELHEEHPGIVAMKAIARSYIWWLNLNEGWQLLPWNNRLPFLVDLDCTYDFYYQWKHY